MNLLAPIDIYCERLDASFWAEPLNAISNISFFISAYLVYRLQKNHLASTSVYRENMLIAVLLAMVGVGSFIFHTFGNVIGMIADVGGIMIFVHTYLYIALRRLLSWSRAKSAVFIVIFFALLMAMDNVPAQYSINGSEAYLPCLIVILWMWRKTGNKTFLHAAIAFILSLFFRTIDMSVCKMLPIGTHLMWHLLNGAVLYLLAKALIQPFKRAN